MLTEVGSNEDHSVGVKVTEGPPGVTPVGIKAVGSSSSIP